MRREHGGRSEKNEHRPARTVTQKMPFKPGEQGRFIKRERCGAMKMAAGNMARRAAGIKDAAAVIFGQARNDMLFERRGRQRRNLAPMPDRAGADSPLLAQPAINRHPLELKGEQRQRQAIEALIAIHVRAGLGNERAHPEQEIRCARSRLSFIFHNVQFPVPDSNRAFNPKPAITIRANASNF